MDHSLIGCWRVKTFDMVAGRTVRLIGGLPGERVAFTEDGRYITDLSASHPGENRYSVKAESDPPQLDVWIEGLEPLVAHCVYRVEGDQLRICIAGDSRPRPTELRRDDERLWCVVKLERSAPPKRRKKLHSEPLMEPGALIPKAWLKKPQT